MITDKVIIELVKQYIHGTDIFLVEATVKAGNMIQIHVDRPDGISVEECAKINRHLNENLDREVEDFSLEVSSPGLNAPFRVKQQYEKNTGRMIEAFLMDGAKLEGLLQSVSDTGIKLQVKGKEREIKFEEIKKSKAVITFN